ncbi:ESPR-type extended signal peptide-containing protein, partial [Burkholderia cenocepacia]
MNKSYRTVWNATTGTWAAAPETARMRTKSKANSTMRSSVTAAVAVMAGVGGGTVSVDAMAQATGGGLNLCSSTTAANGVRYGQTFGALSNTANANCGPINSALPSYQGHTAAFILGNNANTNGATSGIAPTASVMGGIDGHLVLYGQNGVHVSGPADFNNNVNMTGNRINNLAAGVAGTDAVNLNQLNSAIAAAQTTNPYVRINSTGNGAAATGANAVAIGQTVTSAGSSSVAVGSATTANGLHSIALGASATNANASDRQIAIGSAALTSGQYTIAMGYQASATAADALALGRASSATNTGALAIGANTTSGGSGSTAIGQGATVVSGANNAVALGINARVANSYSAAIGSDAYAAGNYSSAVGPSAQATGTATIALGGNSTSTGNYSVAIGGATGSGRGAVAAGANSVAIGTTASTSADNAVALGYGTVADRANTVSVGAAVPNIDGRTFTRQIVNVAAGTQDTDAVNLGQMNTALSTKVDNTYIKIDTRNGTAAAQAGSGSVAIGTNTSAAGSYATALGNSALASGDNSTVLGFQASSAGSAAVAIGSGANASGFHGIALGVNAQATHNESVALGASSVTDRNNSVSVGSSTLRRQITNVAAGTQGTDAVNVGQLSGVTTALGGGAAIDGSGNVTQPTYTVAGNDYHNVGDALDALAANGGSDPNAVTYDGSTKDTVTLKGADGTTLSNVKAGVADMDAVNVSQLKGSGLIGDDGESIAAVTYDRNTDGTPNYGAVTLGNGAGPTQIKNVADGMDRHDAINVGQLQDAGLVAPVDPTNPGAGLTSLAVTYDDTAKDTVTLKGT